MTTKVKIDGDKLKQEIFKRGMSMQRLSVICGFSAGYISNSISKYGEMEYARYRIMCQKLGVDENMFLIPDAKPDNKKCEEHTDLDAWHEEITKMVKRNAANIEDIGKLMAVVVKTLYDIRDRLERK